MALNYGSFPFKPSSGKSGTKSRHKQIILSQQLIQRLFILLNPQRLSVLQVSGRYERRNLRDGNLHR